MGRVIDLAVIPDSNVAPEGIYLLRVIELQEASSKKASKYQPILDWEVVQDSQGNTDYSDVTGREWFTIGTDDDPDALDYQGAAWRSISARVFKSCLVACGYPLGQFDMDDIVAKITGTEFWASVGVKPADGDYQESNRIKKFFAPGKQTQSNTAAPPARTQAPPARTAAPPPRQQQQQVAPPARAAVTPGRPAARPAPRQQAQAPAEAGEEQAVAETRATPAATSTTPARRSPPKSGAGAGPLTQHCAICERDIPRAEFQAHVREHD